MRCPGWSDYYPNHKGGNAAGRSVEGVPYDAAALGDWSDKVQPSMGKNYGFVVKTNELRAVQYFNRSPRAFAVAMRVFLRTEGGPAPASRDPDQRCVVHRADAEGRDGLRRRAVSGRSKDPPIWIEYRDGRPHRRGRPRRRRAGYPRRHDAEHRSPKGRAARRGWVQPQRRHAPPLQRRPAQRR